MTPQAPPVRLRLLAEPPAWPEGRPAAVLVSLWPPAHPEAVDEPRDPAFSPAWRLLYILRGDTGGKHDGQVAFPGGALEPGDAGPVAAALREAREELSLETSHLAVQGFLTPLAIPVSGFAVTPVVALGDRREPALRDAPGEVSGHFFVALQTLRAVRGQEPFVRAGRLTRFPVFTLPGAEGLDAPVRIWGATAWITANFLDRL